MEIKGNRITLTCANTDDMRFVYNMAHEEQAIHDLIFCNDNEEMTWEEYHDSEQLYFTGIPCRNNYWLINVDGDVIGTVSHSYNNAAIENMEIDIWLRSVKYIGKGYGSETIIWLTDYLNREYKIETFIMRPGKHNIGAIKCYEKCGFTIIYNWNAVDYYNADDDGGENAGDWGDGDYGVDGTVNMVKKYVKKTLPAHCVAAGGFIRNGDGKILLVKHPRRGWEFPGGQVEVGESIPQGLKREIYEESGIEVEIDHLAAMSSNVSVRDGYNGVDKIPPVVSMHFICTYKSGELRKSDEHLGIGWFSANEMLSMITRQSLLERAKHMLNFDGQIHYHAHNSDGDMFDDMMI